MADPKPPKQEIITIEPPLGGWISDYVPVATPLDGTPGKYRYSYGMTAVRPGKKGHIAPAEIMNGASFSDPGPAINSLPRAVVSSSDIAIIPAGVPNSYITLGGAAGTAPRIVISDNTNTTTSHHDIAASSGHNFTTLPATNYWGEDICFYPSVNGSVGSNSDYIFYSWNDSALGDIGRYDVANAAYDDDFMSTVPTGAANLTAGVPHRMCVGPDRIKYATNGQFLASYDGTSDTSDANGLFNPQALDFGPGWMSVDVQPHAPTYTATAVNKVGTKYNIPTYNCDARVILWNGSDLDFTQLYVLDDWYVSAVKSIEGTIFAFTQGVNGTTKVKALFPGTTSFQTIWEAPTAIVGNAPLPNQIEYFNGMIQWAGDTTTNMIFALLEEATKTGSEWTLHTPYCVSDGVHTTSKTGFLKNLNSNILFVGVNASGNKIIGAIGDGVSNGSMIQSIGLGGYMDLRDRVITLPYKSSIKKLRAFFSSFGSNSSMLISLIPNYTSYAVDGSGNITGDKLQWLISPTNHPNIVANGTASTGEIGGKLIPDLSQFWLNFRNTNTSISAVPPILKKLEIVVELVDQP